MARDGQLVSRETVLNGMSFFYRNGLKFIVAIEYGLIYVSRETYGEEACFT